MDREQMIAHLVLHGWLPYTNTKQNVVAACPTATLGRWSYKETEAPGLRQATGERGPRNMWVEQDWWRLSATEVEAIYKATLKVEHYDP